MPKRLFSWSVIGRLKSVRTDATRSM